MGGLAILNQVAISTETKLLLGVLRVAIMALIRTLSTVSPEKGKANMATETMVLKDLNTPKIMNTEKTGRKRIWKKYMKGCAEKWLKK